MTDESVARTVGRFIGSALLNYIAVALAVYEWNIADWSEPVRAIWAVGVLLLTALTNVYIKVTRR